MLSEVVHESPLINRKMAGETVGELGGGSHSKRLDELTETRVMAEQTVG